jgi:predicted nucleic acid-binding protein
VRAVLDVSAAISVVMRKESPPNEFGTLLQVMAPDLFIAETVNTAWKYHEFAALSRELCDRAIEDALNLVDVFVPCAGLRHEAFHLARVMHRPAYDMFYLALAQREDAALFTRDLKLRQLAKRQGIRILA